MERALAWCAPQPATRDELTRAERARRVTSTYLLACLGACTTSPTMMMPGEPARIPISVTRYPGNNGLYLRAGVSINGSAPVDVLVDSGSVGLRVFAADLAGTAVETTSETSSATFGNGNTLVGHTANADVTLGDASARMSFQLVEQFTCDASVPDCDLADGSPDYFTSGSTALDLQPARPARLRHVRDRDAVDRARRGSERLRAACIARARHASERGACVGRR